MAFFLYEEVQFRSHSHHDLSAKGWKNTHVEYHPKEEKLNTMLTDLQNRQDLDDYTLEQQKDIKRKFNRFFSWLVDEVKYLTLFMIYRSRSNRGGEREKKTYFLLLCKKKIK